MRGDKIKKFKALAGQQCAGGLEMGDEARRKLGAQLLLSEVLEYVIHGLGVEPEVNGMRITAPDELAYHATSAPDATEMVDGIADVAYTMYWNALAFGLPIEEAFELVCDNNLEKFVSLGEWASGKSSLDVSEWDCKKGIAWPPEVVRVDVVGFEKEFFAVGKDARGKVRKPSSYQSVDLAPLVANS